jgi:hypothetical protein
VSCAHEKRAHAVIFPEFCTAYLVCVPMSLCCMATA